jgi:hypothetical protein
MHGYGEFNWTDGKKYIGFYKNDKKEGFGIYYWDEPCKVYIGFWKDGKQNGVGKYIVSEKRNNYNINNNNMNINIKTYYGIWKNGEKLKISKNFEDVKDSLSLREKMYLEFFSYDIYQIKDYINRP